MATPIAIIINVFASVRKDIPELPDSRLQLKDYHKPADRSG